MGSSAIWDSIRGIFALFDRGIYNLIGVVYEIIEIIAEAKIVEEGYISDMANRLYSFIAIFMVFKISFSLINYLINPDSITDKEKGGTKLITNIVLTFAMIILVPFGFDLLREAQSAILSDDIIGTIVSGQDAKTFKISELCSNSVVPGISLNGNEGDHYETGQFIALVTVRPFVQIDESHAPQKNIEALIADTDYCKSGRVNDILSYEVINHDNSNNKSIYTVDYNLFISTIVGGAILLILISFTFDIALRAVKLVFLEIIAPVPVMSFIEPGSAKKGLFNKWLKEVGVTWADLFLRLFAVTFSTSLIGAYQFGFGGENSIWIDIIILAGLLMFAKKLPDILKKMFNIDLKGDFQLNPFKKFQDNALGGKQIMGATTGLMGAALGAKNILHGDSLRERLSNAGRGMKEGLLGGYKNPTSIKGLRSGSEFIRKEKTEKKEQIRKAKNALAEISANEDLAKKLADQALGEDGKYHLTKIFKNQKYIDSYNRVDAAKTRVKNAEGRITDADEVLTNVHASQEERRAALEQKKKAQGDLKKYQGQLDFEKEQHKYYQSIYQDDAKKETLVGNYLKRNSNNENNTDSRSPLGGGSNTNKEPIKVEIAENSALNNSIKDLCKNINDLNSSIFNLENQRNYVEERYSYDINRGPSESEAYNKEHRNLEDAIAKMMNDRENMKGQLDRLIDSDPTKAMDELQTYVDEVLKEQEKRQKGELEQLQSILDQFTPDDYQSDDYMEAKKNLEKAQMVLSNTRTEIDKINDTITKDLPRMIEKQKRMQKDLEKTVEDTEELFQNNE